MFPDDYVQRSLFVSPRKGILLYAVRALPLGQAFVLLNSVILLYFLLMFKDISKYILFFNLCTENWWKWQKFIKKRTKSYTHTQKKVFMLSWDEKDIKRENKARLKDSNTPSHFLSCHCINVMPFSFMRRHSTTKPKKRAWCRGGVHDCCNIPGSSPEGALVACHLSLYKPRLIKTPEGQNRQTQTPSQVS